MVRKPASMYLQGRKNFFGGIVLGCGLFLLIWLLFFHQTTAPIVSHWTSIVVISSPISAAGTLPAVLTADGINLTVPTQASVLSEAEALQIASQLNSDAASGAKTTSARYALLTYTAAAHGQNRPDLQNVPVWMIWFQKIVQPETSAAFATASLHDLYVFINANTGQMELTVWG